MKISEELIIMLQWRLEFNCRFFEIHCKNDQSELREAPALQSLNADYQEHKISYINADSSLLMVLIEEQA